MPLSEVAQAPGRGPARIQGPGGRRGGQRRSIAGERRVQGRGLRPCGGLADRVGWTRVTGATSPGTRTPSRSSASGSRRRSPGNRRLRRRSRHGRAGCRRRGQPSGAGSGSSGLRPRRPPSFPEARSAPRHRAERKRGRPGRARAWAPVALRPLRPRPAGPAARPRSAEAIGVSMSGDARPLRATSPRFTPFPPPTARQRTAPDGLRASSPPSTSPVA